MIISILTAFIFVWKNVLKPVAKVVKSVIDIMDPPVNNESRVYSSDSRVFDGKIRRLSKAEADAIKNDGNVIEVDYVIND
jgi:hypothetical protein